MSTFNSLIQLKSSTSPTAHGSYSGGGVEEVRVREEEKGEMGTEREGERERGRLGEGDKERERL